MQVESKSKNRRTVGQEKKQRVKGGKRRKKREKRKKLQEAQVVSDCSGR